MKRHSFVLAVLIAAIQALQAQPLAWESRGVGGGGSLYSPSINPSNPDEFYVGCDMSGLYHTTDFGDSYALLNFQQMQGGHNAKVEFTNNPQLLYCVTYANDQAVPVKSTDGGTSWNTLPGNPDASEETFTIAVDYNLPNRVILGYYGSIQFSADGGNSFRQIYAAKNSGAGVNIGGTYFDGNTIVLGTNEGLIVSTDGGVSFAPTVIGGLGPGERIFSIAAAKQGSTVRFYCLTADSNDVYNGETGDNYWGFMKGVYSLRYGSGNWISCMNGIAPGTDFPMFVATASNDTSVVYLGGSSTDGAPNIMKSTNGGASWSHVFLSSGNANISTGWSGSGGDRGWGYGECVFGLGVAPNDSRRVLFTDFGFVHRTSDGGTSWSQAYLSPADQNPTGHNTPTGKAYHGIGLEVTSCWQVCWSDPENVFAAFTDIKGIRSTDGGNTWSFNYAGDNANTMYRIARRATDGVLFAATSDIHDMYQSTRLADAQLDATDADGKIISSTDKGAHWTTVHLFNHPVFWIALDPSNQNRMYASVVHSTLGGVYVTDDLQDGASSGWTRLASPPRTEGHPASLVVLNDGSLVCSYSGRRTSAGFTASSGVFIYTPATSSWKDVSDPGMHYWTKDVVVDPADSTQNTWYVGVFSGWGGPPNGLGGLYRTTDRGGTWKRISALDRVTSCTINPWDHSEMYLTTETNGLWRSTNFGSPSPTFSLVGGYPFRQPERVFYDPFAPGELWVTSFGAGLMVGKSGTSGVLKSTATAPAGISLQQNFPNPFNPSTTIRYTIGGARRQGSGASQVRLVVYDILGRQVAVLVNAWETPGTYTVQFDATGLASGIYFCRLQSGTFVEERKLCLVR